MTQQAGVAEAIRAEIAKIPTSEFSYAKPSRILPLLKVAGFEITPSVRAQTSKLLAKAKSTIEGTQLRKEPNGRRELAMRLIEACEGNFELVRAEIARLEHFIRSIKSGKPPSTGQCLERHET